MLGGVPYLGTLRNLLVGACALLFLCTAGSSSVANRGQAYRYSYENVLGTSLDLKIVAVSEGAADRAEQKALDEIERLSSILSGYDPASEFSRWVQTRNRRVPVSPELFEVLRLFDQWRERTGGALDASAETITRLWKHAASEQRLPTSAELEEVVASVRQEHWQLDNAAHTATHLTDAPLVLNSFAKSYIVNRAAEAAMRSDGVTGVVVDIGGDLVVRGAITEPVAIADPFSDAENGEPIARLAIHDRAVATSGSYRRGVEIAGRHYSHIVDPRTGRTAEDIVSSTVVSPDGATAGALATAFSVMTPAESMRLAAAVSNTDFLIVSRSGKRYSSLPLAPLPAAAASPPGFWDVSMELTVHLELARVDGYRARRPFVAIWIEDKDKSPVRLLALWYQKSRYASELKAWWKSDTLRAAAATVSSATRSPGKYTVRWDGKDNSGKYVKAGKYTVYIEASREHGTYQLIRGEMDFSGTPQQTQLQGGAEVIAASLEYRKAGK